MRKSWNKSHHRVIKVWITGDVLDVVDPPLVVGVLELNGRHQSAHGTRYCLSKCKRKTIC